MQSIANRRRHVRYPAGIDCKLIRRTLSRYDAARTGDVSAGGAMLEVHTTRPIHTGEVIEIAVNWSDRPVLSSDDKIGAKVLRAGPLLDGTQQIAIGFDRTQDRADALAGAEAA